ncbi:MAG: LSM domain-containing protein [Halobacteriaceae archaeon]
MSDQPLDVLEAVTGDPVTVQLKDGVTYRGVLTGFDQHMNLVIDPTGAADRSVDDAVQSVEDTTVIRGDNVVTIRK